MEGSSSEADVFKNVDDVQQWLQTKGVEDSHCSVAAPMLFSNYYTNKSSLEDVTEKELIDLKIPIPIARSLKTKLAKINEKQDQLHGNQLLHDEITQLSKEFMHLAANSQKQFTLLSSKLQEVVSPRGSTTFAEEWGSIISQELNVDDFHREFKLGPVQKTSKTAAFTSPMKDGLNQPRVLFDDVKETAFQEYVMEQLKLIHLGNGRCVVDTSKNGYLDGRKPDVSMFEGSVSSLCVLLVGEVKCKGDLKSPSSRGELLTFLKRVILSQPLRKYALGFLTDGCNVVLMGHRKFGEVFFTHELSLDNDGVGRVVLAQFMQLPSETLGFVGLSGIPDNYIATKFVGSGVTSLVYSGRVASEQEDTVAIKVCSTANVAMQEHTTLKFLNDSASFKNCKCLPTVVHRSSCTLILSPLAQPFTQSLKPKASHILQLLGVLKIAHQAGVVHRDIRPENWMVSIGLDNAVLIDWGFATESNKPERYSGTLSFASDRVLREVLADPSKEITFTAADDLASFVRIVFYYVVGKRPVYDREAGSKLKITTSLQFWELECSGMWRKFAEHAEKINYDALEHVAEMFG